MSIRLPNTTVQDTPSGRATWSRAVVDSLRQLNANVEAAAGGGVSDADYGDIVVSGGVWSFDTGVVTAFAKTFLDDANAAAVRTTLGVTATGADTAYAFRANNLSDLANAGTARTNLGVGTGDSPQFTAVNIGAATDTTLARSGAGDLTIEGNAIYRAGGTDVPVADGGTGASTAAGAATSLGLGTGDSPQFTAVNLGHASDTTLTRVSAGVIAVEGVNVVTTAGNVTFSNDISVPDEVYGSGWNASVEVPTKNAVYDKIEANGKYIGRTAFNGATNVDIPLPATHDSFYIEFYATISTDNQNLLARVSDDNFSTVKSASNDYSYAQFRSNSTTGTSNNSATATFMSLVDGIGNAAGEYVSGKIDIINAKEATLTQLLGNFAYTNTATVMTQAATSGDYRGGTVTINGLRLLLSSGTLTGFYKIWGRAT